MIWFIRKASYWHLLLASAVLVVVLILFSVFIKPSGVRAAGASVSPWFQTRTADFRILSGQVPAQYRKAGVVWAALQVRLAPGWKTYWRSPGDTGVPPSFDWGESVNLKKVEVLWPAPHRFVEAGSTAIGYKGSVVLPLRIVPEDASQAVTLGLGMSLGVCKDICVPVQQKIRFTVPVKAREPLDGFGKIMRTVPVLQSGSEAGEWIRSLGIVTENGKTVLKIEASFARGSKDRDLFLEAPEEFYLPLSKLVSTVGDRKQIYSVDLADVEKPQALVGEKLKITLVSSKGVAEVVMVLGK